MKLGNLSSPVLFFSSFTVTLSAAVSASPPLSLFQLSVGNNNNNNNNNNITNPVNITLPHSLNALPRDPTEYYIPSSRQKIRLSHYGRLIPRVDVLACLLQATTTVIRELNGDNSGRSGRDDLIDADELQVSSNAVHLIMHPGTAMTWGMWGSTLRGLADFVDKWESVELDFAAVELGDAGIVGSGLLVYI